MVEELEKKVFKIFGLVFGLSSEELNLESSTENIEGWDSAKHINLILALEDELNIEFDEEDIFEMLDLKTILDKIKKLKS